MAIDGGLRKIFTDHLPPAWHFQAIESWGTSAGIPDLNACCVGLEVWIEFKKTEAVAVKMRAAQVGWHLRRFRAGGRTFIAIWQQADAGPRRDARDELFLYHGRDARVLADIGLAAKPLGRWPGGPSNWNWQHIEDWLKWPNR